MPDEKRIGPFSGRQVVFGLVGGGGAYLLYRWYRRRQAGASTALAGGTTIPAGGAVTSASPLPTTLAQWQQDALAFGQDPISTLNAITNWLAGNCVDSKGYGGLTAAIGQLGLPPGFTNYPVLTVCANGSSSGSGAGSGAGGTGTSSGGTGTGTSAGGGSYANSPNGTPAPTVGSSGQPLGVPGWYLIGPGNYVFTDNPPAGAQPSSAPPGFPAHA